MTQVATASAQGSMTGTEGSLPIDICHFGICGLTFRRFVASNQWGQSKTPTTVANFGGCIDV